MAPLDERVDPTGGAGAQGGASGRVSARPRTTPAGGDLTPGVHRLELQSRREALLCVPNNELSRAARPLVVSFHGAGGDARAGLWPLEQLADEAGFLLLSVASRGRTWDALGGSFGPDLAAVDDALAAAFARSAVDAARVAISGFSDGASYALSVGLANGDLFSHVAAFSPGFVPRAVRVGRPRVFVSHGTMDEVLPIASCSRRIVADIRRGGHDVRYDEFEGPHTVPVAVARAAIDWFLTPV